MKTCNVLDSSFILKSCNSFKIIHGESNLSSPCFENTCLQKKQQIIENNVKNLLFCSKQAVHEKFDGLLFLKVFAQAVTLMMGN